MYEVMMFSSAGYVLSLLLVLAGIRSLVMDWLGAEKTISKTGRGNGKYLQMCVFSLKAIRLLPTTGVRAVFRSLSRSEANSCLSFGSVPAARSRLSLSSPSVALARGFCKCWLKVVSPDGYQVVRGTNLRRDNLALGLCRMYTVNAFGESMRPWSGKKEQ
jgi:hypothetical protein